MTSQNLWGACARKAGYRVYGIENRWKFNCKGLHSVYIVVKNAVVLTSRFMLISALPDCLTGFLNVSVCFQFWNESVDDQSVKELVCPECLLIDKGFSRTYYYLQILADSFSCSVGASAYD